MNSLSWFIYLADVLHNLGNTMATVAFAGIFISAMGTVLYIIVSLTAADKTDRDSEWAIKFLPTAKVMYRVWMAVWVVSVLLHSLLPSRNTMYMIAASEAGQMIIDNKGTQEIVGDLKDIITDKLKKMKEGK